MSGLFEKNQYLVPGSSYLAKKTRAAQAEFGRLFENVKQTIC